MSNKYRTHNCNELRLKHVNTDVLLSGWINKKRDHGNLLFIDLRDNYGITQCIIDRENPNFIQLEKTQLETVIKITTVKMLIIQPMLYSNIPCLLQERRALQTLHSMQLLS